MDRKHPAIIQLPGTGKDSGKDYFLVVPAPDRFDRLGNKRTLGQKCHELRWRVVMCNKYDPSIQFANICYCRLNYLNFNISQMFTNRLSILKQCMSISWHLTNHPTLFWRTTRPNQLFMFASWQPDFRTLFILSFCTNIQNLGRRIKCSSICSSPQEYAGLVQFFNIVMSFTSSCPR